MSFQTTFLLQTRHNNSVETVLGESNNYKRNVRTTSQLQSFKKNKSNTHHSTMFATRGRFSDISNFLASTDWVPFDNENSASSNFFSCAPTTTSLQSPLVHRHDRYTSQEETAMDWARMNNTTTSSSKPRRTSTTSRPSLSLRRASNKSKNENNNDQHIVSKQVANTWVNMGCSSSKQTTTSATVITPLRRGSAPNPEKSNEHPAKIQRSRSYLRGRRSVRSSDSANANRNNGKTAYPSTTRTATTRCRRGRSKSRRVPHNNDDNNNDKPRPERRVQPPSSAHHTTTRLRFMSTKQHQKQQQQQQQQSVWRSAKDPKSGRVYYYNVVTRETQWRKPMELASEEEKQQMMLKEQKQKDFFAAMERNILKNMKTPVVAAKEKSKKETQTKKVVSIPKPRMVRTISTMDENVLRDLTRVPSRRSLVSADSRRSSDSTKSLGVTDLHGFHLPDEPLDPLMESAREMEQSSAQLMLGESISHFDADFTLSPQQQRQDATKELQGEGLKSGEVSPSEELSLEDLQALQALEQAADEMKRVSSSSSSAPSPHSMPAGLDLEAAKTAEKKEESTTSPPATKDDGSLKRLTRPKMSKRNTCGTIYVGTTMSAPDKDATIKCVCGVYRAHILQSAKEEANLMGSSSMESDKYIVFNDYEDQRHPALAETSPVAIQNLSLESVETTVPTLDEITSFYRDVFRRSQMETDCIIMSLIYVERLIKDTDGALRPRVSNWRSILFSCMVLSSKVWDDLSMWNADFSQTCPAGVTLFNLKRINELEIAVLTALKYNVKVKSSEYAKYYFLLRSMIIKSGLGGDDLQSMAPLDVEGAKKLEQLSSNFSHHVKKRPSRLRATKSLDSEARRRIMACQKDEDGGGAEQDTKGKVSLEHVVNM